jgi:hypothetical protein
MFLSLAHVISVFVILNPNLSKPNKFENACTTGSECKCTLWLYILS